MNEFNLENSEIIITNELVIKLFIEIIDLKKESTRNLKALKTIFERKKKDSIKNDGIWFELLEEITDSYLKNEKISLSKIEKVEQGIDILTYENGKIHFKELKSSTIRTNRDELQCKAFISQFTKKSKDIAQYNEFLDLLAEDPALEEYYKAHVEKLDQLIDSEKRVNNVGSIAYNALLNDDYDGIVCFSSSISSKSRLNTTDELLLGIENKEENDYSKHSSCTKKDCELCNDAFCVKKIKDKIKIYTSKHYFINEDFDLNYVYDGCIQYINEVLSNEY